MNQIHSSSQLKAAARISLTGRYPFVVSVLLLSMLLMFFLSIPVTLTYTATTIAGMVLYYITSLVIAVLYEIIRFHIFRIFLMLCCNQQVTYNDLFFGNPDRSRELQTARLACIMVVIQYICTLPSNILLYFYTNNQNAALFLAACVTFIIGFSFYAYIYLSIFPIYFLSTDCSAETTVEMLRLAAFISKGHRLRLLYILISFLPLLLLCMFSCGIGFFWVLPYMAATLTHYYLNLASTKSS